MKIIYFTKYTHAGPSSRYRSYQYFPYFEKEGIAITARPFFTTAYIEALYGKGKRSVLSIIPRFIQRFFQVLFLKKYDIIFIEYELFPYTPLFIERWLLKGKKNIVFDYDDAIFHNYDRPGNRLINWLCQGKIYKLVQMAETVITGSPYLTEKLQPYAKKIVEIPTSIEYKKYEEALKQVNNIHKKQFRIGWIGSKTTSPNIILIKQVLINLQSQFDIELVLIGFDKQLLPQLEGVNYFSLQWNEKTEIELMQSFDVGIMPLENTDFNKGKCGFKLIQYMACGVPTISTPLVANVMINHHAGNLFASNEEEWEACFKKLIANAEYFKNIVGKKNKEIIKELYSVEANGKKYSTLFTDALNELGCYSERSQRVIQKY